MVEMRGLLTFANVKLAVGVEQAKAFCFTTLAKTLGYQSGGSLAKPGNQTKGNRCAPHKRTFRCRWTSVFP